MNAAFVPSAPGPPPSPQVGIDICGSRVVNATKGGMLSGAPPVPPTRAPCMGVAPIGTAPMVAGPAGAVKHMNGLPPQAGMPMPVNGMQQAHMMQPQLGMNMMAAGICMPQMQMFYFPVARHMQAHGALPGNAANSAQSSNAESTRDVEDERNITRAKYQKLVKRKLTNNSNVVFVGGLRKTTEEDRVISHFAKFGQVESVDVKRQADGTSRGFAFVKFADVEAIEKVMDAHEKHMIDNKWVEVKRHDGVAACAGIATSLQKKAEEGEVADVPIEDESREDYSEKWSEQYLQMATQLGQLQEQKKQEEPEVKKNGAHRIAGVIDPADMSRMMSGVNPTALRMCLPQSMPEPATMLKMVCKLVGANINQLAAMIGVDVVMLEKMLYVLHSIAMTVPMPGVQHASVGPSAPGLPGAHVPEGCTSASPASEEANSTAQSGNIVAGSQTSPVLCFPLCSDSQQLSDGVGSGVSEDRQRPSRSPLRVVPVIDGGNGSIMADGVYIASSSSSATLSDILATDYKGIARSVPASAAASVAAAAFLQQASRVARTSREAALDEDAFKAATVMSAIGDAGGQEGHANTSQPRSAFDTSTAVHFISANQRSKPSAQSWLPAPMVQDGRVHQLPARSRSRSRKEKGRKSKGRRNSSSSSSSGRCSTSDSGSKIRKYRPQARSSSRSRSRPKARGGGFDHDQPAAVLVDKLPSRPALPPGADIARMPPILPSQRPAVPVNRRSLPVATPDALAAAILRAKQVEAAGLEAIRTTGQIPRGPPDLPTGTEVIEQKCVAYLIGKGGQALAAINAAAGVSIQIDQSTKFLGWSMANIYGTEEGAAKVKMILRQKIAEYRPLRG